MKTTNASPITKTEIKNKTKIKIKTKTLRLVNTITCCALYWLQGSENQKSKTSVRARKLLDFLVFLGFSWFSKRNPKKSHGLTEIQKNTRVFFLAFHQRPNKEAKNTWCFCFPPKIQKKTCEFLDFCWKTQKPLGKPNTPKASGP